MSCTPTAGSKPRAAAAAAAECLQCLCLASFIARAAPAAAGTGAADAALTPPLHVHHATGKKPVALMIAPTRELALQIAAVLEEAGSQCGIRWGRYARAAASLACAMHAVTASLACAMVRASSWPSLACRASTLSSPGSPPLIYDVCCCTDDGLAVSALLCASANLISHCSCSNLTSPRASLPACLQHRVRVWRRAKAGPGAGAAQGSSHCGCHSRTLGRSAERWGMQVGGCLPAS